MRLQRDTQPQRLERGKAIERELSGRESHLYQTNLTAGQYLRLVVDQRGIDVVVALFTPDGKKAVEVNGPYGSVGEETLSAISEVDGTYRIEVRSAEKTAKKGSYQLKLYELKEASAEDRYRVTAESVFQEADKLSDGTLEEKRMSIEKYKEALALYQKAGDRSGEGSTNNNIGYVQEQLGEMQAALASYDKALSIKRAIRDRNGQAEALTNIGAIYSGLGEQQKALEKYNEALLLCRAVGDRRLEGVLLNNIGSIYKSLGDLQKAIEKFNEALTVIREVGVQSAEIGAINIFLWLPGLFTTVWNSIRSNRD
jgi:tetratricopeptide (TPR) repeat protein